jgi:hypothetical protein
MADIFIDWNSFCAGLVIGFVCVWVVSDLVFPVKKD